jgi:hypothetical protein
MASPGFKIELQIKDKKDKPAGKLVIRVDK